MAGRGGRLPKIVEHVSAAIYKANKGKKGWDAVRALATAISRLQAYGILKEGTLTLTEYGRKVSRKHYGNEHASFDVRKFFKILKRDAKKKRRKKK